MVMNSGSFESPKSYISVCTSMKKQRISTFKVCNFGSNYPYLLRKMGFVDSLMHTTVDASDSNINESKIAFKRQPSVRLYVNKP